MPGATEQVEVDGLRIGFQRAGSGPPLVLLHGYVGDGPATWRPQIAGLSDEFTVVAWDAPGAGRSSDPPDQFGRLCCVDRGPAQEGWADAPPSRCSSASVQLRRVPVPTKGDHAGSALVPAVRAVLPRCGRATGRTRHSGGPRHDLPVVQPS